MVQESNQYNQELSNEIRNPGGEIETGTTNSRKIYWVWMDVKATLTKNQSDSDRLFYAFSSNAFDCMKFNIVSYKEFPFEII